MKFTSIFVDEDVCNLWAVCYPEHAVDGEDRDIFSILFDDFWSDTSYVRQFLKNNITDLTTWGKFTISEAIDQINRERYLFDRELGLIETEGNQYRRLTDVFKKVHDNIFCHHSKNEYQMKGKPDIKDPMLRLYGIELDPGLIVITGGAIKVKKKMEGSIFEHEFNNLERVKEFMQMNKITNRSGLIKYKN